MMVFLKSAFFLVLITLVSGVSTEWRWTGKVAVVTGAGSGIGEVIALTLADKGVIVVALARSIERLEALSSRTTGKIHAMQSDFLKEEDILSVFRAIEEKLGGVDILINNPGTPTIRKLKGSNTDNLTTYLDLHVLGLTIATREALKTMRSRGDDGQIININSIAGHQAMQVKYDYGGLYSASKSAVTALTQELSNELADWNSKIKVSSLGVVVTELVRNFFGEPVKGSVPEFTQIEYQDIADGVVYILSTRPNVKIPELTIEPTGQAFY